MNNKLGVFPLQGSHVKFVLTWSISRRILEAGKTRIVPENMESTHGSQDLAINRKWFHQFAFRKEVYYDMERLQYISKVSHCHQWHLSRWNVHKYVKNAYKAHCYVFWLGSSTNQRLEWGGGAMVIIGAISKPCLVRMFWGQNVSATWECQLRLNCPRFPRVKRVTCKHWYPTRDQNILFHSFHHPLKLYSESAKSCRRSVNLFLCSMESQTWPCQTSQNPVTTG